MKDALIASAVVLLVAVSAFLFGRITGRNGREGTITERVDTLVIRDTVVSKEPIYVTRRIVDSVLVPVTDTMRVTDTLYVILEREQVMWEDSLARVYASGIRPQVDSVIHFREQVVITREIPVKVASRWGIGFQAGVGAGKAGLTPYVGVGVSYNLLSW